MATLLELDGVGPALRWTRTAADEYQDYRRRYMTTSRLSVDGAGVITS
jgi:hypothetical protein